MDAEHEVDHEVARRCRGGRLGGFVHNFGFTVAGIDQVDTCGGRQKRSRQEVVKTCTESDGGVVVAGVNSNRASGCLRFGRGLTKVVEAENGGNHHAFVQLNLDVDFLEALVAKIRGEAHSNSEEGAAVRFFRFLCGFCCRSRSGSFFVFIDCWCLFYTSRGVIFFVFVFIVLGVAVAAEGEGRNGGQEHFFHKILLVVWLS